MGQAVHRPRTEAIAFCVRVPDTSAPSAPVTPGVYAAPSMRPATRMARAVAVHTTMVSTSTPKAWMKPCCAGWATVADPAAQAAPPSPASLENRPRRTPLRTAIATPPAVPARPARRLRAPATMSPTAEAACTGCRTMITATRSR